MCNMAATSEHELLLELAAGKKTFEQIASDARKLQALGADLPALTSSNPARNTLQTRHNKFTCFAQRLDFFKELEFVQTLSLRAFRISLRNTMAPSRNLGFRVRHNKISIFQSLDFLSSMCSYAPPKVYFQQTG